MSGARVMSPELSECTVPYVFPLYVDDPDASYQDLRSAGIPIYRWDEVWPGTPAPAGDTGPNWSRHVFQLGCHQDLSLDDLGAITASVRGIIQRG